MDRCIAIVSDLIFATRITGTAKKVGAKCEIVSNPSALQDALESDEPRAVLVDMNCDGISPEEAIRTVKSRFPNARVVAFYSHVQTKLGDQARAAGADDVWPRSAFVQRLPQVLAAADRTNRQ
ncbi:MAG: response regulator transcription factor [Gemmatimonadetes bacterium]|nr:response regulator transcription factor [Gemmatimonadota bacterium]